MRLHDIGTVDYSDAWRLQEEAHARVVAGGEEELFLLEHPAVITLGRRPDVKRQLAANDEKLRELDISIVQSDRGGDITFHGPGQLVAYPIIRLADHHLSVGSYVRRLEDIVIATLARFNVHAHLDPAAIGVWTDPPNGRAAKICALGVRIRRGVSMHGIALNVVTDLRYFNLIVPCGLPDREVTSLDAILRINVPTMASVKTVLSEEMIRGFTDAAQSSTA